MADAVRAQGYVTAQDRLWQMDVMRRAPWASWPTPSARACARTARRGRSASIAPRGASCAAATGRAGRDRGYAAGVNAFIERRATRCPSSSASSATAAAVDGRGHAWPSASCWRSTWRGAGTQEAYRALFARACRPKCRTSSTRRASPRTTSSSGTTRSPPPAPPPRRRARQQQLGDLGGAHGDREAAPRQRPAPRPQRSVHLDGRAPVGAGPGRRRS